MTNTQENTDSPLVPHEERIPVEKFVPHMTRKTFKKGHVLFKRGDPASGMYYIENGSVRLTEIDKVLGKGNFLGEMGVFCPIHERTVSAVCEEDLTVRTMNEDGVLKMLENEPRDVFPLIQLAIKRFAENLRQQTAAKERMDSELRIARDIQLSSLPNVFPAFPDRFEFDLFASMDPAEEVGGDFYDFFFVDKDTLFMVVGDVSGKGVPAALFMMTVKTLLKGQALEGMHPEKILSAVNNRIFPENSSLMFVTILCAMLNVRTGEVTFGNAGHNPPLVSVGNGNFDFLDLEPSPVLGIAKDSKFTSARLNLGKSGTSFLYTDGVTDASNSRNEFFSEDRLKSALSRRDCSNMKELAGSVRGEVRTFVQGSPQFDDITILAVRFNGDG